MPSKPKITTTRPPYDQTSSFLSDLAYSLVIVLTYLVTHIFFREVEISGLQNVPKKGPVILVCGPHSNQFVDAAIVYTPIKQYVGRKISCIIAESSYKKKIIGTLAKLVHAIPVPRAQDNLTPAKGKIKCTGPVSLVGVGTKFSNFEPSGIIGLPNRLGNMKIKSIESDTELTLASPLSEAALDELSKFVSFKYCPKVDTNSTFQNVYNHLFRKGMIAIFPEGGSHDRTQFLPLKPGVGIMALGAAAAIPDPDVQITIVPTGLYYFHPNRFRSRAVLEFGQPLVITKKEGEEYLQDPRKATNKLLETIKSALESVTITAPDRETLRTIQAIRRLYKSGGRMNLPTVNEVNRRLLVGWKHYLDDPRIQRLFKAAADYNHLIHQLGVKDYQIREQKVAGRWGTLKVLVHRLSKLIIFGSLSLPGVVLFAPVFLIVSHYSRKKQMEALRNSTVKVKAIDVVALWKVIIATVTAPIFYIFYSVLGTYLIRRYHFLYVQNRLILFVICYLFLVFTTYCSYRIGEVGMDIVKSLPPLFMQLISQNSIVGLKQYREELATEVTDICNELGPSLFPDFDKFYEEGIPASLLTKNEMDNLIVDMVGRRSRASSFGSNAFSDTEEAISLESSYEVLDEFNGSSAVAQGSAKRRI